MSRHHGHDHHHRTIRTTGTRTSSRCRILSPEKKKVNYSTCKKRLLSGFNCPSSTARRSCTTRSRMNSTCLARASRSDRQWAVIACGAAPLTGPDGRPSDPPPLQSLVPPLALLPTDSLPPPPALESPPPLRHLRGMRSASKASASSSRDHATQLRPPASGKTLLLPPPLPPPLTVLPPPPRPPPPWPVPSESPPELNRPPAAKEPLARGPALLIWPLPLLRSTWPFSRPSRTGKTWPLPPSPRCCPRNPAV